VRTRQPSSQRWVAFSGFPTPSTAEFALSGRSPSRPDGVHSCHPNNRCGIRVKRSPEGQTKAKSKHEAQTRKQNTYFTRPRLLQLPADHRTQDDAASKTKRKVDATVKPNGRSWKPEKATHLEKWLDGGVNLALGLRCGIVLRLGFRTDCLDDRRTRPTQSQAALTDAYFTRPRLLQARGHLNQRKELEAREGDPP
jgi:hypothetical protein